MRAFVFTMLLLLITSACSVPQQEISDTARETKTVESNNTIAPIATEMFDSIHSATTAPTDTRSPVLTSPETEAAIEASVQPTRDPSEDEFNNETEPTVGSTVALSPAKIYFFEASPRVLNAGDVTDLSWSASGLSAEICLVSSYTYFADDDCQPVPVSGSLRFTVPEDLQPSYALGFRLAITGEQATDPQQAYIYLNLLCDKSWFYDGGPASGPICPQEAISSWAAIQEFENGTMIWLESLARYYILTPGRLAATPLNQDGQYIQINTPLNVTSDSSGDYEPPEGYFAPDSGFGIVWRGDIAESSSLIDQLGWATSPEFGYQTTFQCSDSPTSQLGSVCYLKGPQGELLWLDTHYQRWQRLR